MFEYFNRKIAYKIIRRSVIALALFILFTNFVILYDPLTGVGGLLYKLYLIAAFVCIVEAIWVFFNLRFEIVSRFILTLLIGLCFISYGLPIIAPDVSSNVASAVYQYRSATLISSGDNAIIQNLDKVDTVQVFGAVNGYEKLIREYKIK